MSWAADRVQYCRVEADMDRWQEQWESRQAQFLNYIRGLKLMAAAWHKCSESSERGPGYTASAKKTGAMYLLMVKNAEETLMLAGYGELLWLEEGKNLADRISFNRADPEVAWHRILHDHRLPPPRLNDGMLYTFYEIQTN